MPAGERRVTVICFFRYRIVCGVGFLGFILRDLEKGSSVQREGEEARGEKQARTVDPDRSTECVNTKNVNPWVTERDRQRRGNQSSVATRRKTNNRSNHSMNEPNTRARRSYERKGNDKRSASIVLDLHISLSRSVCLSNPNCRRCTRPPSRPCTSSAH